MHVEEHLSASERQLRAPARRTVAGRFPGSRACRVENRYHRLPLVEDRGRMQPHHLPTVKIDLRGRDRRG
jgi:hypothetical protein